VDYPGFRQAIGPYFLSKSLNPNSILLFDSCKQFQVKLLQSEDGMESGAGKLPIATRDTRPDKGNDVTASTPQVFSGITPAQYAKLTEKAKAAGVAMSGNSGRASRMGVEVDWNYSEERQELVLTCLKTPFFVKAEDVNAKLHALVSETLSA